MFSRTVVEKSIVSCGTMPICSRSDETVTSRMSKPSMEILPDVTS